MGSNNVPRGLGSKPTTFAQAQRESRDARSHAAPGGGAASPSAAGRRRTTEVPRPREPSASRGYAMLTDAARGAAAAQTGAERAPAVTTTRPALEGSRAL